MRTVNGAVCTTYQEACKQLNFPENDANLGHTLAIILSISSNPKDLLGKYKDYITEDTLCNL